uniref:Exocyst subunit Exo70 family protein n=1 Tax=Leersia perrieri TaxID=77586 RepID=A0A0D9WWS4_9ORYZ
MPTSRTSTNMSLGLRSSGSAYSSSYDSRSCSDGTGISRYQKSSDESGICHCKQFLENIPEDGGVMTTLAPLPDLLPTLLRLYLILERFPVSQRSGIHRVTSHVMNYVKILWEYDFVLNIILVQDDGESENPLLDEKWTRVDSFVQHLIGVLDTLVERKAKYKLMGLECIFLLNNAHFLLQQLQKLEMKSALQHEWIPKYNNQVEHQIMRYLDLSWQPVCSCLDAHTTWTQVLFPCFHPHPHPLTIFYAMLESTCAVQQDWKIEDPKLRQQVRKAVSSRVIQCYQSYLQLQKKNVKFQKHVRYTPQELENKLMELFEG